MGSRHRPLIVVGRGDLDLRRGNIHELYVLSEQKSICIVQARVSGRRVSLDLVCVAMSNKQDKLPPTLCSDCAHANDAPYPIVGFIPIHQDQYDFVLDLWHMNPYI